MSRAARLVLFYFFFPLLAQAGVLDTHERETQKRREDGYRADAPNNPGSTPKVPQGFIDEMRRRTEPQGGQDISPATRAYMAEQEEKRRREAEMQVQHERMEAEKRARVQMDYNTRLARVRHILEEDASSATPRQPAMYDRAMEVAWPDASVMLQVARVAQQAHPELWRLRLGFLMSAGCDPEALATSNQYVFPGRPTAEKTCKKTRYERGYEVLRPLLKSGSVMERALVCGLLYNWQGRHVVDFWYPLDVPLLAGSEATIAAEIKACVATLPAGHAFTTSLFEPLFLLGERDRRDVGDPLWLPLVTPSTWAGVDPTDVAAIRAVFERVAADNEALQPKPFVTSTPPVQAPDPLLGSTPDQVRKALGRPSKKVQRGRQHMPSFPERSACLEWHDRGPLEAWAWGKKDKQYFAYQVKWVVFNREGKACATYNQQVYAPTWKEL